MTRFLVLADEAKTWGEHECLDGASMLIAKAQGDGSLLSAFCFPFKIHCVGYQIQIEDLFVFVFFSSCAIHHHRTHRSQLMNLSLGVLNGAPHKQGKFKVFYSGLSFAFVLRDRPPQFQLGGLSARSMFGIARRSSRFQATAEQSPFKGCLFSEVKWRKSAEKNAGGKKGFRSASSKNKETPAS